MNTKVNVRCIHPQTHTDPAAPVCLFWHCENDLGCSLYLHQSNQRQPSGSISQHREALRVESSSKSEDTCEDSLALLQKFVCHWAQCPWHQAFDWDALIQTTKHTNKHVIWAHDTSCQNDIHKVMQGQKQNCILGTAHAETSSHTYKCIHSSSTSCRVYIQRLCKEIIKSLLNIFRKSDFFRLSP